MILTQIIDWSSSFGRSFVYLLVFIALMALAYYAARFFTAKARGTPYGNLKVIEGLGVGQQGNVLLIKAGKKYILIGVTKDKITFLTELGEDDLNLSESAVPVRFESYLKKIMKTKKNEKINDE